MNRLYQKQRAYEWYSAFNSLRDVVEVLPRSGRPSTSSTEVKIAKNKEMVTENRHLSLKEIPAELSVSHDTQNLTNIIEQPPYSPDMAPADFFLLPKFKLPLRGTCFQSIEDIKGNSRRELKTIPENAFKKCFDDWIIRWHKCIISGGTYFEVDKTNLDE